MTDPMKKDDIEKLAHRIAWRYRKSSDTQHSDTYTFNAATLHEFVKTVVSAERERCAKLCDAQFWIVTRARGGDAAVAAGGCAAAIRGANESISGQRPESRCTQRRAELRSKRLRPSVTNLESKHERHDDQAVSEAHAS